MQIKDNIYVDLESNVTDRTEVSMPVNDNIFCTFMTLTESSKAVHKTKTSWCMNKQLSKNKVINKLMNK